MHTKDAKQIIRGADAVLTLVIRTSDGDALDLTDATAITVRLKKEDASELLKTLAAGAVEVESAHAGRIAVTLSETDTAGLYVQANAPIEVVVDFGSTRRIAQIRAGLNVVDRLF